MVKIILLLLCFIQGCAFFIHTHTYSVLDKSRTTYDIASLFSDHKSSGELLLEAITQEKKRTTGFSCGNRLYSDWPCLEAEGCVFY